MPLSFECRAAEALKLDPRRRTDQSADVPYLAPKYPGLDALTAQLELGEKIYPGSCHCGAVTFALRTLPLDDPSVAVKECDCSLCLRVRPLSLSPSLPFLLR